MAKHSRSYDLDDVTKQAAGRLFFTHLMNINAMTTGGVNLGNLGLAVKQAKGLVSLWLDDDEEYRQELDKVRETYDNEAMREELDVSPRQWRWEQRLEELECIKRSADRCGVFKTYSLEWDPEPL